MIIIFIRHGEPDYSEVIAKGFIGHGFDLAQLSPLGRRQAMEVSSDQRLDNAELIVSSPYTRALQTAAIISKERNLDIEVETDLHEWLCDLNYLYNNEEYAINAAKTCSNNNGICPFDSLIKYEDLSNVFNRAKSCLKKYLHYNKIIVVAHGILIRQFNMNQKVLHCGISEIEFYNDFRWCGFVEKIN